MTMHKDLTRVRTLFGLVAAVLLFSTPSYRVAVDKKDYRSRWPTGTEVQQSQGISVTDSSLPPAWVYGHWVWEDESTQQSAVELVNGYLDRGISVTAVIIDSPWETAYNTFEPDPSRFPDFEGMVSYFHSKGVRVICWITGVMNLEAGALYEEASTKGFFMTDGPTKPPKVVTWWKGKGSLVDFFNPEASSWWNSLMDKTFALGVDGFKVDATDPYAAEAFWSPYLGRRVSRLEYSRRYYASLYEHTRRVRGAQGMITARPVDTQRRDPGIEAALAYSFSPPEIGWSGWVGDQISAFDPDHYTGMRGALLNYYYSSHLGYFGFGSDIGGYIAPEGARVSANLLTRWAGLGAFSPVMENGGIADHRPWIHGPEIEDAYRRFVRIHLALVPYILELAGRYPLERRSAMRFLDRRTFSYMLGPDIFIQPILDESDLLEVRLPEGGRWRYLFEPTRLHEGGSVFTMKVPSSQYPVFIRKGSSMSGPLTAAAGEKPSISGFADMAVQEDGKPRG